MPFASFVGVNHHGQSILFGCGLISREDIDTYVWLFKAWLECMKGRPPKAIITDQCRSMQGAVAQVFPQSHPRLCLWHIMKKIPEKLSRFAQYKKIKGTLKTLVYESTNTHEFEDGWCKMIDSYSLEKNEWLHYLYNDRRRWVPVYVKELFWAGMSTTQRSESMNSFFDGYVNSKTSLRQFVEQYDNALKSKIEKETKADFECLNSSYTLITKFPFERQFHEAYTNAIFKLFQDELRDLMSGDEAKQFDQLCSNFYEVVHIANSRNKYEYLMSCIQMAKEKLTDDLFWSCSSTGKPGDSSTKLLPPVKVRSKGRPPSKRKESVVEKAMKKKRNKKVCDGMEKKNAIGPMNTTSCENEAIFHDDNSYKLPFDLND